MRLEQQRPSAAFLERTSCLLNCLLTVALLTAQLICWLLQKGHIDVALDAGVKAQSSCAAGRPLVLLMRKMAEAWDAHCQQVLSELASVLDLLQLHAIPLHYLLHQQPSA